MSNASKSVVDIYDGQIAMGTLMDSHSLHIAAISEDDPKRTDAWRDVLVREYPAVRTDDQLSAQPAGVLNQRDLLRRMLNHVSSTMRPLLIHDYHSPQLSGIGV